MQTPLNISDKIQIASIIVTTIISVISIGIAVLTLKQNNKMIEASTRPYVIVYGVVTNFQTPIYKIVVKNFGQSGAIITYFETDYDLVDFGFGSDSRRPFENLRGTFIAPGQSFITAIDYTKVCERNIQIINFKINYKLGDKSYFESIDLNLAADKDLLNPRASTKDKELKIISYTLQDLVDKNL